MLDRSTRLRLVNLTCDGDQAWAFGSSLYNYLNLVGIHLAGDQLADLQNRRSILLVGFARQ